MTSHSQPAGDGPSRQERHLITPDIARMLLDHIDGNRDPDLPNIRRLSEAIRQGRWQITHQGIAVTGDSLNDPGRLLDGQNRCAAIVETGIPVEMYVAFNCPPSMFNAIDIGKVRNVPDLLTIRGYKNSKKLAVAWGYAWCWERGRVSFSPTKRDDLIASLLER